MRPPALDSAHWSTASISESPDTTPLELDAMRTHLHVCQGASGRLFALRCAVERLRGFAAPRRITTLVLAAGVVAAIALVV